MSNDSSTPNAHSVRFVLDGEAVTLDGIDPTRTILQYLREDLRRTGTKEGCAEGDCGACTVVLGEADADGRLRLRAVNSCIQFLPTVHGKQLFTVESLSQPGDPLHPVQQAMVDCHGSQCGFCTPGFVMSLFALFKNQASPTRREVDDALAGNLCRCTGYRPIVDAATEMYRLERPNGTWLDRPHGAAADEEERSMVEALGALADAGTLGLNHNGTAYHAPTKLEDLLRLASERPQATLLAGGTDVGLWVTKQLRQLSDVIYIGDVDELKRIEEGEEVVEIGAGVSLTDAMPVILRHYPDLEELFLRFASPPIRNAGTLGGNVANGSPIGDSMPALIALGASIVLRSTEGERELPLDAFYIDYQKSQRRPGEVLTAVRVPLPKTADLVRSYKISKRFDQDISAVCAAFRLRLEKDRVRDVRVAFGGMAATPKRAAACEQSLTGKVWDQAAVDSAMSALEQDFQPISDMRAGDRYRRAVARNLLQRFYLETTAAEDRSLSVYAYGR